MCTKVELEAIEQEANGRGTADRPGDPLFPLVPRVLEALRKKMQEERGNEALEGDDYSALIETICGATDDSQPVEQYNGALGVTQAFVANHQAAVGQIQWNDDLASIYTNPGNVNGARWCSGTMISNDLFLTAGHCFDQTGGGWERPRVNGTSNIIPSAEIAQRMHVNFNYQVDPAGNLRPEVRVPILALVEYRLAGLDFAIVRLAGNPGSTYGRATISTGDAASGDMLCLIGHPAGLPKRIEAGPALAPQGSQIRYDDIDTLGGNSGSGVLRASDGRLVGVHTNGGCTAASPDGSHFNFGQRIAALIAASPTLQALTQPSAKFIDDIGTRFAADLHVTLKGSDDIHHTALAADLATHLAADTIGTIRTLDAGGTLKFRDDVKHPGLDKSPYADVKLAALDNPNFDPLGPVVNPAAGGLARPFVLSTPHHSMAWAAQGGVEAQAGDELSGTLEQLATIIAEHETALEALQQRYQELAAAGTQQGEG